MTIDYTTKFKVTNKLTHKSNTGAAAYIISADYPPKHLIDSVMKYPGKECELIKSEVLSSEILEPITVLSDACFCIAICCFIGMPDICKSLAETVFTAFSVSIADSGMHTDAAKTKAMIKEFVIMILKEHEDFFNKLAEKLGVL